MLRQFPKKALDSCKNDDWASGLEWTYAGDTQPAECRVLDNQKLAQALTRKEVHKFTQEEWDGFGIKDLSIGHVVQSGSCYFTPDTGGSVVVGTYNTYPTTINALLSGMQKLMWVAPVPRDRFVYRGLGGLNLPDTFFAQDEFGLCVCVLSPPHTCAQTLRLIAPTHLCCVTH